MPAAQLAKALVEAARAAYGESQSRRTRVFALDRDCYSWRLAGAQPSRPLSSVVLPPGVAEALRDDAAEFLRSEAWYARRGMPYRRGYLLHGPPGTGKSSVVAAIAGELNLDIHTVSLSSGELTDNGLREVLCEVAGPAALLLEDVDAAFAPRAAARAPRAAGGDDRLDTSDDGGTGVASNGADAPPAHTAASGTAARGLTLAGLLNAIDGVAAQEGKLLFMTTNRPEALDPALVRPGRIDVRCAFQLCSASQTRRLFLHFYSADSEPGHLGALRPAASRSREDVSTPLARSASGGRDAVLAALATVFGELVPASAVSPASLQGFMMRFRHDPAAAVCCVRDAASRACQDGDGVWAQLWNADVGNGEPLTIQDG
jgi:mitochondrial chaperone BCS1